MLTLLSTLISFLAGGLPKLLGFFQDRADKKHEMAMAQLQIERELELRKAGFEAQQRVEEINVEGQAIEAEASERAALYAHDIAIGQGCKPVDGESPRWCSASYHLWPVPVAGVR